MKRRQVEQKIATMEGLQDIVHSMRAMAASHLQQAQAHLDGARSYAETVGRAIEDCLRGREIRLPGGEGGRAAVLAIFSEQGFCGRFNEILAEAAHEQDRRLDHPPFIVVGSRGRSRASRLGLDVLATLPSATSPGGGGAVMHQAVRTLLNLHDRGVYQSLYLLHAEYLSPGQIRPRVERVLPVDLDQWRRPGQNESQGPRFGLPRLELLNALIDEYAYVVLLRALVESLAGENGMRLRSMEGAKSNIDDTLSDLTTKARMLRQSEITEELLEVVAGAEALREGEEEGA